MEKYFICMAVSYKYGGKCIGGVEVVRGRSNGSYSIVKVNGVPKWVRPVTQGTNHGEIPNYISDQFQVMDILKIDDIEACPDCAQSENYYFSTITKVGRIPTSQQNLDLLCDSYHGLVFGNRGRAVTPECYSSLGYSLMLIKPESTRFFMENRYNSDIQRLRVCFTYNGNEYNLPVTDPEICHQANYGIEGLNNKKTYYLTLSLGVQHDGWHSKLVANVISI